MSDYFDADLDCRRALSRASRERAGAFTEAEKTRCFRRQFRALLDDVGRSG